MRKCIVGLLLMMMLMGCGQVGATHDLLAYDNIIAATLEAKKGVEAFNLTVETDTAHRQEQMLQAIGVGIKKLAESESITPEQAETMAAAVVESLRTHLANYTEQQRRRARLYEVTIDNLNYIIQVSEQGKKLTIYRADLSQQWKDWLQSSARNHIETIE